MNDSMVVFSGLNSTTYETFWPCVRWHLENWMDYDLALAACSHLPDPFQVENRKIGIASAVVGAASLLMNGVVLCGIVRNHHLTESMTMYMFVANLAVADCVAAVGVVLLSVDRYLVIFYPIFYKTRMSGRHVAVSLGIAWPVCAVVCLSPLMGWNCIDSETENCIRNAPVNYLVLINAILAVAVIVVVFVNVRIFIVLKQRFSRAVPLEQPQENLPAARRREQRVAAREQRQLKLSLKTAVTVVMIAAMFIIIWLPIYVGFVRGILCHANEECATEARPYWGLLIAFCGSVVNPVIYAFRIKTIREALVRRTRRITNAVRERLG
ncbi:cannabinoid receptor 1-like [Branchiostoma lanceolatum]|uniref:cannabinoid receptor 1-like n=1 Tax=Branchiostoma lanceolatum TaxID=7740 RepID=UPI003455E3D5